MMGLVTSPAMMILVSVSGTGGAGGGGGGAQALDGLLQDIAYQAFPRPMAKTKTGVVYDGVVPSNLTGVRVSAVRLRSGSLRRRGISRYKEFGIPKGVEVVADVERMVLVYHNLGNWSRTYYPLPGYTYLAPVLGLVAYDASNLMARNLPELHIQASSRRPISIKFSELITQSVGSGSGSGSAKCVLFDLNGSVLNLSDVLSDNICTTFQLGHFSIVAEEEETNYNNNNNNNNNSNRRKKVGWIVVGSAVGGFALLGVVVVWLVRRYRQRKRMHQMERAADVGEALHMTTVGSTKAPAATGTRTQPTLQTQYLP